LNSAWQWIKKSILKEGDDESEEDDDEKEKKNTEDNSLKSESSENKEKENAEKNAKLSSKTLNFLSKTSSGSEFTSFILSLIPVQYFSFSLFMTSIKVQLSW
jgi:hypothetical protein